MTRQAEPKQTTPETVRTLQAFEDEHIVPLVRGAGAEPVRTNDQAIMLVPGDVVFMMTDAASCRKVGERVEWSPLSVKYCDALGRIGNVMWFDASLRDNACVIDAAIIAGVVCLEREGTSVIWRDGLSHRRLLTLPTLVALTNLWYLFRGAVLPMLFNGSYRFVSTPDDRAAFQANMLHQISTAYRGLL